jgi:hypothetical protein
MEPLTRGLQPPDLRSLCPLSSTEFVESPLPEKSPGEPPSAEKLLDTPLQHRMPFVWYTTLWHGVIGY